MADQMNDERSEGNVELYDGKSFGNSELQQLTSGYGNKQIQEAINPCSLMLEENLLYHDERQNVPEKISNTNTKCFQLGFPFTDLSETTGTHTDSILGNQNIFQQENNDFYAQQSCVTSNCKTTSENETQEPILFEFENYANQILGQKLIQPFVASNNSAAEIKDKVVDAFISDDQQATISDDYMSNSKPVGQEKLWTLCDDEDSTKNELDDNTNKNSKNSEHQQFEKCEVIPTEQQHSVNGNVVQEDFTSNTIFIGLQYIDGKLLNVIGGLSNLANNCKQRFYLPKTGCQKLEATEILDGILHPVPESNEDLHETSFIADFCETDHFEELIAKEIHAESEYSVSGIIPEIKNIKENVIHHITEQIPSVQDKSERTFLGDNCSENEGFVIEQRQTNYINEPTELLISECDPENARQEILREVERGKEFLPSTAEERSDNMKSLQVVENFDDVNKIQNEHKESVECEKLQEQLLCETQQEKIVNFEIEENNETQSKLPDKRETEVCEANTLVYESARVPEEERKSDFASNISNSECEIYDQESNENIVVDNAIIIKKSTESLGFENMREEKNSASLQDELKNVNKDVTLLKPTIKAMPATGTKKKVSTTDAMPPTSKDTKKINRIMIDRKSVTKSAVTLPAVSTARNIKLKEKNNGEAELKHTKKIRNNSNAKILKQNITSKITQKRLHESVNFGKIQLNNNAKVNMKNKPKDIIKEYQKITKGMGNNEKVKKIGIIDLEPLVWTEILIPTYEQIWENYESVNQIIDNKTNIGFEEKTEIEIENELKTAEMVANVESNNKQSMWQMKKNSEFIEIEGTKSLILSERNEINASQCFALSNKNEKEISRIEDFSDCLKISEQNENVAIEEEIAVKDSSSSEKHGIEISSSVAIKSSEATELLLKMNSQIPLEQKTSNTMMGQSTALKPNLSGIQNKIKADAKDGTGEMITAGKEEMIQSEKEQLEAKVARNDSSEESSRIGKKELGLAGSGSERQTQPELDRSRHHGEKSRSKNYQWKGQFGGMYSDVPEEYMHNTAGKNNPRKQQEIDGQQNCPHQAYDNFSDNIELKDNYQQQQSGNQNQSRKQQQQQPGDTNSQSYSGQQGHRKRSKRNKRPRNW
ncbi:hypothetical protein QQG55_28415 [Brugia pahangi]